MRIALGIEYRGTHFQGWQRLREGRNVQSCVESAIAQVANHDVTTACAGRTDSGVHARYQVVHFDTEAEREMHGWVLGCNAHLPEDVSVLWAQPVDERFHARVSATARIYHYCILNRAARPGLLHGLVTWECRPLDVTCMQAAAKPLVGEHDFSGYRALSCQSKSPIRDVRRLEINCRDDRIVIGIEANAFLHHMVRNIAGVLIMIGMGKAEPDWSAEILAGRDRTAGGVTAPAAGLYLVGVEYPEWVGLPPPPAARWPAWD